MLRISNSEACFNLPVRIRSRKHPETDLAARIDLIDRIADLQGVEVSERANETIPGEVDVFLKSPITSRAGRGSPLIRVCTLSCDGIRVYGLDKWARYQVIAKGWGGLNEHIALVYLPRDEQETDAVWMIIRRALENRQTTSALDLQPEDLQPDMVWNRDWPRYSRTSLQ